MPIAVNDNAKQASLGHLKTAPAYSSLNRPLSMNLQSPSSTNTSLSSLTSSSRSSKKKATDAIQKVMLWQQQHAVVQSQANQIAYLKFHAASATGTDSGEEKKLLQEQLLAQAQEIAILRSQVDSDGSTLTTLSNEAEEEGGLDTVVFRDNNTNKLFLPRPQEIGKLQRSAQLFQQLKTHISKGRYCGSDLGQRLYGAALALSPTTSLESFELITAMTHAALLADAGLVVDIDITQCGDASPSASTLRKFIDCAAVDSLFCASQEILQEIAKVFLICDKGAGGKVANAHFVKILCWYSQKEKRVKTYNVNTDEAAGKSANAGDAVDHSLTKMFGLRSEGLLFGQATDSGGGGVGYSLRAQLEAKKLTVPRELYVVAFCTLHCIQLTLGNPIDHILGQGDMDKATNQFKQTAMQLLHGVYNLQKNHESEEWNMIWKSACQSLGLESPKEPKKIPAPILTRWWTVGVCANFLLQNWETIAFVVHGALMNNKQVKSDVHMIDAFHRHFLFTHFSFLQKGDDEIGGTPCFINRHIGGRYFLMHEDLLAASDGNLEGWRTLDSYGGFVASLLDLTEAETNQQVFKVKHFLRYSRMALEKHFDVWMKDLLFLSLFAEAPVATRVARFLVGRREREQDEEGEETSQQEVQFFESTMHGRTINLSEFDRFLRDRCKKMPPKQGQPPHQTTQVQDILASQHVAPHLLVIRQIADASSGSRGNIWDDASNVLLLQFRQLYLLSYAALPSSTHIAESNVKDANFCQMKGRGEALASAYSTARSDLVEPIQRFAKQEFKKKENKCGNGRVSAGKDNERKRKADETDFVADERSKIRGSIRSCQAVKYVLSRHASLETIFRTQPEKLSTWKNIEEGTVTKESQFYKKRCVAKFEEFDENKGKNKPKNALQRRTGIFETSLVLGRVLYSKLRMAFDMEDLKKELLYRGLSTEGGWKLQLIPTLKADEKDTTSFKPQHPDVVAVLFDRIVARDLKKAEQDV
jgi:hypothetical protein